MLELDLSKVLSERSERSARALALAKSLHPLDLATSRLLGLHYRSL